MAQVLNVTTDTFSDILGTISTGAKLISNGINTLASPLDMANTYLTAAKERQIVDTIALMENYETRSSLSAADDQQQFEEQLFKRVHADPKRKAHFEQIHAKLVAKLAARHQD
jgi:hypothetical protein